MIDREMTRVNILTKRRLFKKAGIGSPDAIRTADSIETWFEQQAARIKKKKERIHARRVVFV